MNLLFGSVQHMRLKPKKHGFVYRLFMLRVDIGQLNHCFNAKLLWSFNRFNLFSIFAKDYGCANVTCWQTTLIQQFQEVTGDDTPIERVELITHPRFLGYAFNPISIFLIFHKGGGRAFILRVSNTPWGEATNYYIASQQISLNNNCYVFSMPKKMHVSPFLGMDYLYKVRIKDDKKLIVHIENHAQNSKHLIASMALRPFVFNKVNQAVVMIKYPAMAFQIIIKIYWQALRLFLKRVPFFSHPQY